MICERCKFLESVIARHGELANDCLEAWRRKEDTGETHYLLRKAALDDYAALKREREAGHDSQ